MSVSKGTNSCSLTSLYCASREELKKLYKYSFSLNFSISAVCSGLCVQVLQQSQLHKFHFDFFRLCGLQFCECASFIAVRKFHRRVAHLSSLRACFLPFPNQNLKSKKNFESQIILGLLKHQGNQQITERFAFFKF